MDSSSTLQVQDINIDNYCLLNEESGFFKQTFDDLVNTTNPVLLSSTLLERALDNTEITTSGTSEKTLIDLDKQPADVSRLLKEWDLEVLTDHFIKNQVSLDSLKYARRNHLPELLNQISWGIKVKFEYKLFEWQKSIGSFVPEANPIDESKESVEEKQVPENRFNLNADIYAAGSSRHSSLGKTELIDIKQILNLYAEGKQVLKLIEQSKTELPEAYRQIVVDKIVDYFVQNGQKLNVSAGATISKQIKVLFPDEITEYYFAPQTGKAPKGKLLAKYYNQIRKLKESGFIEKNTSIKRKQIPSPKEIPVAEEDAESIKQKLKYIQEGERWEEVKQLWKSSENYRRKMLIESDSENVSRFIDEWPAYKHPLGYTLIDLDFNYIYPNCSSIFNSWDTFATHVIEIFQTKIKDRNCKQILLDYIQEKDNISEEGRNTLILHLIHAVLVPTSKKLVTTGNKKILQKFTISDSQESFILLGNCINQVEQKLEEKRNAKMPIQPLLVVVHDDILYKPQQYLVYFDNIKYKFFSLVPALDCAFKIFQVFDLKYPLESVAVWQFVQLYFYSIKSAHDIVLPNINVFINSLNKANQN